MLSLAQLTIGITATPMDVVDAAIAGEFDAIGLRLVPPMPGDSVFPLIGNKPYLNDLQAKLKDHAIQVLDIEAVWLTPDTHVPDLEAAFELGAALGAKHVLVLGNDSEHSRLVARLSALSDLARRYGLKPALEWHPYVAVNNVHQALKLLNEVGQDKVSLLVDALHLYRSGGSALDLAAVPAELMPYWQICDASSSAPPFDQLRNEARNDRRYPGAGGLDLGSLLDVMPRDSVISVEAPWQKYAELSASERGMLCAHATRDLLAHHYNTTPALTGV